MATQLAFQGSSLLNWRRDEGNWPDKKMYYYNATADQVCFVGDTLPKAWCDTIDEYRWANGNEGVQVIGLHTSKSCHLPVYGLDIPTLGVRAVLSYNFHQWTVSLELPRAVDLSMFKDRMTAEALSPIYCYGFSDSWVKGPYTPDALLFTVQMWSQHDIYAMFMFITHQLRAAK
jgi:hypothetical protein